MVTPEIRDKTTEEWQYWGGFLGEALRPNINREVRQPRPTARNPMTMIYYKPRLQVFDRRRHILDYIEQNFGGEVREHSQADRAKETLGFSAESGFFWILSESASMLALLKEVQPYMIAQGELVRVMIDFLSVKQERLAEYRGSHQHMREVAERRMEEEAEFFHQLREARNHRHQLKLPLTPANIAGVLDISGAISIYRGSRSWGYVEYGVRVEIHSDNNPLLETLSQSYRGLIHPTRYGIPPVYSDRRFYCGIGRNEEIINLLQTTWPYLNLQRRQAELTLKFIDLQQDLTTGSERGGWRRRRGDLAQSLQRYSTPSIDLVTMLREGFYSEMYRLNHEQ